MSNNQEMYYWIKNALNGVKNEKALCLYGPPATGKGLFIKMMTDVMGGKVVRHINPIHLAKAFNHSYLENTKLLVIEDPDEKDYTIIKGFIRDEVLRIEKPMEYPKIIPNHINVLVTKTLHIEDITPYAPDYPDVIFGLPLPAMYMLWDMV